MQLILGRFLSKRFQYLSDLYCIYQASLFVGHLVEIQFGFLNLFKGKARLCVHRKVGLIGSLFHILGFIILDPVNKRFINIDSIAEFTLT
jgi:hypothetical protein